MRGGEDELLKLEHHRLTRERHQAKEREVLGLTADPDLMAQEEEEMMLLRMRQQHEQEMGMGMGMDVDLDALMADAIAQQEAAEVDALVQGLELESGAQAHQFSDDDEDYDGLLLDFIQQQEQEQEQQG
ncbi:hypothetical protein NEMBOFW57_006083 [Staphylotrichum longicolle]|uniref:Uncharacterized protein n=1 Tax=Staphylotrichum longicolle TaxID=669026 RepID=A0AAD4EY83_9PEZI|nr:hypothetical protein NEMBOFW57_006083 [Staphylotrichum longicolle]